MNGRVHLVLNKIYIIKEIYNFHLRLKQENEKKNDVKVAYAQLSLVFDK